MRSKPEKENQVETNNTTENIEDLKKALEEERSKAEANLAGWQRAQADFINFKRYAEQEKAEYCKFANASLLCNLLPVFDDFERALAAIPPEDADKGWVEGLKLIYRKFRDTLEKQGVSHIECLGKEFDPRCMDAITCVPGKKDTVLQEIEKGYTLQDKVIRPAKVAVGSGEQESNKEE